MQRQFIRTGRATMLAALSALVVVACGQGRLPTVDVLPPPDTPDTGGPYEVTAVVRTEGVITSANVRWFVSGDDAPRPLAMTHEAGTDWWSASIPGQPAGAVVRFTVEVEDDEGHLVIRPAAPKAGQAAPTYQFRVLGSADGG